MECFSWAYPATCRRCHWCASDRSRIVHGDARAVSYSTTIRISWKAIVVRRPVQKPWESSPLTCAPL